MGSTHLIRIYEKTKANLAEAKRKHVITEEKHVTYDGFVQVLLDAWNRDH